MPFPFSFWKEAGGQILTPAQIFGANYYDDWDFGEISAITETYGLISKVASKTGSGRDFISTSNLSSPQILLNQINGLGTARFDGVNDYMYIPSSTGDYKFLHDGAGGALILISQPFRTPSVIDMIISNQFGAGGQGFRFQTNSSNQISHISRSTLTTINNTSTSNFVNYNWFNSITIMDADNTIASERSNIIFNGSDNKNNIETALPTSNNATDDLIIGMNIFGAYPYRGNITRVIVVDTIPTAIQLSQLQSYLQSTYGTFPISDTDIRSTILDAYLSEYNTISSGNTGTTQYSAITTFVDMLYGIGTTNNSNLLQRFVDHGTKIFPLLPMGDDTADANVYSLELMNATQSGTYNNFVSTDFTNLGVVGGSGKYFDSGVRADDYPLDNVGYFLNVRNVTQTSALDFMGIIYGAGNDGGTRYYPQTATRSRIAVNASFPASFITVSSHSGLVGMQRRYDDPENSISWIRNGSIGYNRSAGIQSAPNGNIYVHCLNDVGNATAARFNNSRMNVYILGTPRLDQYELKDLYDAVLAYNTILGR